MNAGVSDYWIEEGTGVFLGKDPYYNEWEVARADLRDAQSKGKNSVQLNTGLPQNKYLRLKNAVRLLCRPVGGNPNNSTLVGVRGLLYDDNYYDLNRFTATGRIADMFDLAPYIPTAGNEAVVIVWLDTFNNSITATSSTAQAIGTGIDITDYQEAIDKRWTDDIPIQAFHLSDAQTSVNTTHLGEDLRQWLNMPDALGLEYELTVNTRVRDKRQYLIAGTLTVPVGKTMSIESGGQVVIVKNGNATRSYQTITTNYTVSADDDVILCNPTSNITLTLPALSGVDGQTFTIKNKSAYQITVDGNGSETIDGSTTKTIKSQYTSI